MIISANHILSISFNLKIFHVLILELGTLILLVLLSTISLGRLLPRVLVLGGERRFLTQARRLTRLDQAVDWGVFVVRILVLLLIVVHMAFQNWTHFIRIESFSWFIISKI